MKEGKQVDCTQAVIAQPHNWLGTQDAKVDPVGRKVINTMLLTKYVTNRKCSKQTVKRAIPHHRLVQPGQISYCKQEIELVGFGGYDIMKFIDA